MLFTDEVDWDVADFLVMGVLLFGAGLAYVLLTRKVGRSHRLVIGVAIAAAVLWLWAELALGVFTDWGS